MCEADTAKKIWENLRRCLTNALNRRRSRNGKSNSRRVAWKYEQDMSFLLPFLVIQSSSQYEDLSQFSVINNIDGINDNDLYTEDLADDENPEYQKQEVQEFLQKTTHKKHALPLEISKPCKIIKTEKKSSLLNDAGHSSAFNAGNEENLTNAASAVTVDRLDEDDLFFLSMSKMSKRLSKIEQANIKLLLCNAILNAEMKSQHNPEEFDESQNVIKSPSSCSSINL